MTCPHADPSGRPDARSRPPVKLWSLVASTTTARIVYIPSIMNVLDFGDVQVTPFSAKALIGTALGIDGKIPTA